ncbi:low density lipoprotein receptor adapter protein 1-like isoform X2 [Halichondria panicea]|uniref:low density lipoprotein receptor adapter protein 1-like isoform X2 n=1 Tax=Halichondria panicea TaxID=6063 RepID=UPI00312B9D45
MSDLTTNPTAGSSTPENITIIVPVVLGSIIVLLVVALVVSACLFLKKRRKLCFGETFEDEKPILSSDNKAQDKVWPFKNKPAKPKPKKKKKHEKGKYHSLGRAPPRFKSDPFAKSSMVNPLADDFDQEEDWTNPLFDTEKAAVHDAVICIQSWYRMIRVRIPFLELRKAVMLCQALYRGILVRQNLPQLKRDKQLKDQQKKKQAGWKKKGTLSALKFFEVKGFGFAEVEQLYGLETVRNAAEQLRSLYGGKGKMKLKLFISVKGLKLYDHQTFNQFAVVKISSVSFCTLDPKNKKMFAFINRKKKRNFCHVFQASEHDAQKMVETIAEAFEVTFKNLEEKRESRENTRLAQLKKRAFHRQSQELDIEIASMMEMAETASISTSSDIAERQSMPQLALGHCHNSQSESMDGSVTGSRERLIPLGQNRHSRGSNLVQSQKAPHARSNSLMFQQPYVRSNNEPMTISLSKKANSNRH